MLYIYTLFVLQYKALKSLQTQIVLCNFCSAKKLKMYT